jgi:Zn finger protein HypA/HybF involved in hydrogenase expression
VKLRIGRLSGVVPEALQFAFDALKTDSPAAEAELEIEAVPAVCWCPGCAAEFETADLTYRMPALPPAQRRAAARRGNGAGGAGNFISPGRR